MLVEIYHPADIDPENYDSSDIISQIDGNKKYEQYSNLWYIYGDGYYRQKVALVNKENQNIQIGSISSWKIDLIDVLNPQSL